MRNFLKMFATQFVIYMLAALYYRAIASGAFGWIFGSAFLYSSTAFFSQRRVHKDGHDKWTYWGFALGSGIGSCIGVLITHALGGK